MMSIQPNNENNEIFDNNLIIVNNCDCFLGDNYYTCAFENFTKCKEKCLELNVNVFVIWSNMVYYRKQTIKECVINIKYVEKSSLCIMIPDNMNYYQVDCNERIKYYLGDVYNEKIDSKLPCDKRTLRTKLSEYKPTDHFYQHNDNLLKFIGDIELSFEYSMYDESESRNIPSFVKSRNISHPKRSVLLPLENLYIPHHYIKDVVDDNHFKNKIPSCVWRGANSGDFFWYTTRRASRRDLVLKYKNNEKYNIGLSWTNYKKPEQDKIDFKPEDYIKPYLTIKDQLKYMFVISVEGNDFATNLNWILLSNSVALIPKFYIDSWKMERYLIPYIHYVPLENDFSDLDDKMKWCLDNLDKCEEIAFMSKMYALQFSNKIKENYIINEIIRIYKQNTNVTAI